MATEIFQIEDGEFALALVDTGDTGYSDAWNAPNGTTTATAVVATDFGANSVNWRCQITSGMLSASPNSNDIQTAATFCGPATTTPNPGVTSYTLDVEFLQDPHISTGLSQFLFDHDTELAYFLLGLNGGDPPRAIGRVRLIAGSFGGAPRADLTASLSLPLARKPSIEFGDGTTSVITGGPMAVGLAENVAAGAARNARVNRTEARKAATADA